MDTPIAILSQPGFSIQNRGTAVLSGISADQPCPVVKGEKIRIAEPSGVFHDVTLKSIEYALIKTGNEQYGFILDEEEIKPEEIPEGTKIFKLGDENTD